MIRGGPVRVAVEERADDAAVEHSGEGFVVRLCAPLADDLFAAREAADAKALLVGRAAAEALHLRRVAFLQALLGRLLSGLLDHRSLRSRESRRSPGLSIARVRARAGVVRCARRR